MYMRQKPAEIHTCTVYDACMSESVTPRLSTTAVKTVKRVSVHLTAAEFDVVRKADVNSTSNSQALKAALQ